MKNKYTKLKLYLFSELIDNIYAFLFSSHTKYQPKKAPLFIMGSGRNGSTLLACILNNHPEICIPAEHSFIPSIIKYWYLHPFSSWEKKVKWILAHLERYNYWRLDLEEIKTTLHKASKDQQLPSFIIETIYLHIGRRAGKLNFIWGDKTPSNTQFIKLINSQFLDCKILFLVRDPRDYMASLLSMNNEKDIDFELWRWKDSIAKYKALKSKFGKNIKILSYENLVSNTELEVNQILDWLNLEMKPDIFVDYAKNIPFLHTENLPHHKNILNPINANSIGSWKNKLTEVQIRKIEKQLGLKMKEWGYPLSFTE